LPDKINDSVPARCEDIHMTCDMAMLMGVNII